MSQVVGEVRQNLELSLYNTIRFRIPGTQGKAMFIMFVREQSHLFDDQVSNFFFIGQELFFAYLQMVVFSLRIDKGLRQCRDRFPENFIKGIPVIGIDPALKIEEREEQIVDAFFNSHSRCSI